MLSHTHENLHEPVHHANMITRHEARVAQIMIVRGARRLPRGGSMSSPAAEAVRRAMSWTCEALPT